MEPTTAIDALAALAQGTRLDAYRLLMSREPDGLPAGEVARLLEVPPNTLSTHLAVLQRAGLVSAERQSRSIVYRAELDQVRELTAFLVNDCCGGRPELCQPLIDAFTPSCAPKETGNACC